MCRFYYCFLTAISVLALSACNKDSIDNSKDEGMAVSLEVSLPNGIMWNSGDKIGLFDNTGNLQNKQSVLKNGSGSSIGTFEFESESSVLGVSAYFPYDENAGSEISSVNVTIPLNQKYDVLSPQTAYMLYVGKGECISGKISMQMIPKTGILSLNLSSDGNFSSNIEKVGISTTDGAGDFTVDMSMDIPELQHKGGDGTINVEVSNAVLKADGTPVVVPVSIAPGKYSDVNVTISSSAGEIQLSGLSFDIISGQETSLDAVLSDPSIEVVDFNAGGEYANCYIANDPGVVYKFDAKVMGTGVQTPGLPKPEVLNPVDAFVLWETGDTPGNVIKTVSLSSDGIVSFTLADDAEGNAVIAVTDGKPVEGDWPRSRGTILWSWHIWVTEGIKDVVCTGFDGTTYTIMDRNLGDWIQKDETSEYQGLKYQWGRKDPFVGFSSSGNVIDGSVCTSETDYIQVSGSKTDYSSNESSIWESVAYPEIFFGATYATSYDWYGVDSEIDNRNNFLWGYSEDGNYVKTIFDPSPIGYRVAEANVLTGLTKTGTTSFNTDEFEVEGEFTDGWFFTKASSFFPASGSLAYNNGVLRMIPSYNGREGYYWTSTPDNENARMYDFTQSYIFMNSNKRASGCSVRCVRITE